MNAIDDLIAKLIESGAIEEIDRTWAFNEVLDAVQAQEDPGVESGENATLQEVLDALTKDAAERGVIDDSVVTRDLLDTEIMGRFTPKPSDVNKEFWGKYETSPEAATDYLYKLSKDTNYVRSERIRRDVRWETPTEYGDIELSINLSKPEKDPEMIAKMGKMKSSSYPKCQLCVENVGYAGRLDHPARQNLRMVPVTLNGDEWFLQYSPYSYYNEHCIVLNKEHTPMKITPGSIRRLLSFVSQFPHYFVGSNADLPIVGGSILSHDHFQGGRHVFPMEKAEIEQKISIDGFDDIDAGIVKWPMSVIRIKGSDPDRLAELADRIIDKWRNYSDESQMIFCETEGTPHNTVTPIARRRGGDFELDLVLRNNLTTEEHPLGLFHPHAELHHIKKENIGLIEVMGLAVLPGRLKKEMERLAEAIVSGDDLKSDPLTEKHAEWAAGLMEKYTFTDDNAMDILKEEIGKVFTKVLEDAGVYKRTPEGKAAFLKFVENI